MIWSKFYPCRQSVSLSVFQRP